jgi:Leucine Rich Repeat
MHFTMTCTPARHISSSVLLLLTALLLCVMPHTELLVQALDSGEVGALRDMQAEWGAQLGWTGAPSCEWYGVDCNHAGHVTYLLNDQQLSGPILSSVGNLWSLLYLYLNNNQLSGSIPRSMEYLRLLQQLILSNNRLNGTVPSWICGVRAYSVRNNNFSCPLPDCCAASGNGLCTPCYYVTGNPSTVPSR